ncbi:MAG: single-stranded DNA-binding protein [Chloroflexi bacterium]|nr:single-stranded DNA-binding protein [Chloroflexota bacterium]
MSSYQYTIIIGNVGRDPELRYTSTGVAVCSFSVAVSRQWTDKNTNEPREETTWFKVSAWRGLAETANQFVHKGMQIMITGEVKASAYLGKDGQPQASLELTARDMKFLGRRGEGAETQQHSDYPSEPEDLPF